MATGFKKRLPALFWDGFLAAPAVKMAALWRIFTGLDVFKLRYHCTFVCFGDEKQRNMIATHFRNLVPEYRVTGHIYHGSVSQCSQFGDPGNKKQSLGTFLKPRMIGI